MNKEVMVALDFDDINKLEIFLKQFDKPIYVKVGMELFYAYGPSIIELIKKYNHKVFLDLKLHDIPNTVKSAMKVINNLDVDMVNVHALGGLKMMKEAREALNNNIK
ncbi:MAG: orotidine 5'-phosphate decarboxylase / HUMPS family protein, partial [Mycoplasmatales bacterium]